ncbi:type II and III secretion system protein family protein [Corallincola platygyrae]|uniref:Type II and III secretion system protein family protein n=1 Tax=Corallincola platygyrae TaxID=1193278 RepID=A0ABW4XU35_9GAMM
MKAVFKLCVLVIACFTLFAQAQVSQYPKIGEFNVQLYVGQVFTLKVQDVERIAVGNDQVLSTSVLAEGELMIIPKMPGKTEIYVWTKGNRRSEYDVTVTALDMDRLTLDVRKILKSFNGVTVHRETDKIMLIGRVTKDDLEKIDAIVKGLPNVVNMLRLSDFEEIQELIEGIEGVELANQRGKSVLRGAIKAADAFKIEEILRRYPNAISFVELEQVEMKKMISIRVEILELQRNALEELGIEWVSQIAGPSAGVAGASITNDFFKVVSPGAEELVENIAISDGSLYGSLGMASSITSQINLMAQTGQARSLARPMLNTRSGEKAEFHAGGEFPYPVRDQFGQVTVEFRKYGIMLNIEPVVNEQGKILTDLHAEVSSLDNSTEVEDVPGLFNREISTVVNVDSGQTIVLSGLVQAEDSLVYDKIPYLGDLPLLGALFRSENFINKKSEMVILVTPAVMDPNGTSLETEFRDQLIESFNGDIRPIYDAEFEMGLFD